jgi:hypothetical protein
MRGLRRERCLRHHPLFWGAAREDSSRGNRLGGSNGNCNGDKYTVSDAAADHHRIEHAYAKS